MKWFKSYALAIMKWTVYGPNTKPIFNYERAKKARKYDYRHGFGNGFKYGHETRHL